MSLAVTHPLLANEAFLRIAAVRAQRRRADWIQQARERLPVPHAKQQDFLQAGAKRRVIRAGRRGGKTVGVAILALEAFLAGMRVLYAVPTQEQVDRFWVTCKRVLEPAIDAGVFRKNETVHVIELPGTEQRIKAKTAFNADTLRGDYADILILDEFQLMSEDAWELVGAPMMLDRDGTSIFVYTPPSAHSRSLSKARDKRHAAKLFKRASEDTTGRWATFHFTSHDNPYLSTVALDEITQDMTRLAVQQEILAEDLVVIPGAPWGGVDFDATRVAFAPELVRIVVGVDPHATTGETGIVVAGVDAEGHGYVLEDRTIGGSPATWAGQAVAAYHRWQADRILAEANNGGDMVLYTLETMDATVATEKIWASRGKHTRAEPIIAKYEKGLVHHVGQLPDLEIECSEWLPTDSESPNRMDALVWALTELLLDVPPPWEIL